MKARTARRGRALLPPGIALAMTITAGLLAAPASAATAGSPPNALALSWGSNLDGQLGIGQSCATTCQSVSPVQVAGVGTSPTLRPVVQVAGETESSLALLSNGQVRAWGDGEHGQLGNGTHVVQENRPVAVVGPSGTGQLSNISAIAGGNVNSMALAKAAIGTAGGQVWTWGTNIWGQLGDGTSTGPEHCPVNNNAPKPSDVCSTIPVGVTGPGGTGRLGGVTAIAAGDNHMVALRSDGTVWSWGLNDLGQLGIGNSTGPGKCKPFMNFAAVGCSTAPVEAVGPDGQGVLNHVVAIAAGEDYTIAVRSDGSVWAWGSNAFSTLGQPKTFKPQQCISPFAPVAIPCSTVPVQVAGPGGDGFLSGITAVAANGSPFGLHVLALGSNGTVWAWGIDDMGQLGDGKSQVQSPTPVQVVGPGGNGFLTGITAIAAGGKLSLALRSDGTVWAWGENSVGQLGLGQDTGPQLCTTQNVPCSLTPAQVVGVGGQGMLTNVLSIAAGQLHSLAVQRITSLGR